MGDDGRDDAASTVLVVGSERAMTAVSDFESGDAPGDLRFDHAGSLAAARQVLAASPRDCVVLDGALLSDDSVGFLDDVRALSPGCPVVLLTDGGDAPSDELVAKATTVVETAAVDETAFLLGKIRSAVQRTGPDADGVRMYRTLVETARDGLYRLDATGEITYANDSFAAMLGYTPAELVGSHGSRAMADGELERGQRVIQQVLSDDDRESDILDMEMVTKGGDRVVVAVHFVVLTTDDGTYDGVMGVVRDVTERRARERELERKNERLDSFASMVSHDLRNPLNVATGRLELLQETVEDEDLTEVGDALDRMEALIDDLLELARAGSGVDDLEAVSLQSVVEACWRTVAASEATLAVESTLTVRADRNRLRQLFENLLWNAVEHGHDGVHVVVGDLDDGDGFYVADDGPGIPSDARERVFEPGVSTNENGTGFGLAIVEDVVEAHDWSVALAESESGGARFEIGGVDGEAT